MAGCGRRGIPGSFVLIVENPYDRA
jgi:hypothetical protein